MRMKITDASSARVWLKAKSKQQVLAFSTRAALRTFPNISAARDGIVALPPLRALLYSAVTSRKREFQISESVMAYSENSVLGAKGQDLFAKANAVAALRSVSSKFTLNAGLTAAVSTITPPAWDTNHDAMAQDRLRAAELDSQKLEESVVDSVYEWPLWQEDTQPAAFDRALKRLRRFWDSEPEHWSFWSRWYDGMLSGEPLTWGLQEQVAEISDGIWHAGPERTAAAIKKIEARFELEQRIAKLEAEVARASVHRHGIGGNNPPEPIDDMSVPHEELVIIWQSLQELKEEVERDDPDPSRIGAALEALAKVLKTGLKWCAEKADLVVDTTIKWGIPAVGGGYIALNPEKIEAVIKAGEAWLKLLP